jgi:hypothetical protein
MIKAEHNIRKLLKANDFSEVKKNLMPPEAIYD